MRDAQTLLPVPQALVEWVASGQLVQADETGRFRFESAPDGTYRLCVRRLGYQERCDITITVGPEEVVEPVVYLESQALEGSPVDVVGGALPAPSSSRVVVTREEITRSGASTAADVLVHTPEVEVLRQSDGSARVSIRGSQPEGVRVVVDDVPLAASGQAADLSTIPAHEIERIEIVRGPAVTVAGADALAGAVLITTRRAAQTASAYGQGAVGSYGSREGTAGLDGIELVGQRFGASFGTAQSDGDFAYYDDELRTDTVRTNNESFRRTWSLRGGGELARHWSWRAGWQGFELDAGIPGAENQLTPSATRTQDRNSGSARLDFRSESWGAHVSYATTDDLNHYLNTGLLPYDTEQRSHWYLWRTGADWKSGALLRFAAAAEWMQEDLWGEDHRQPPLSFGTADRSSHAFSGEWSPRTEFDQESVKELFLQLAYRYDYTHTEANYPHSAITPVTDTAPSVWELGSPQVAGGVAGTVWSMDWSARGAWGRSFRRPPMLEQFWVESYRTRGNPELLPERAEQWEVGYALSWAGALHVKFEQRFYWGDHTDVIFWRTGQGGVWTPDNIGSARIDGREESLEWAVSEKLLRIRVDHLFVDHENTAGEPNTDGDPLPFRYRHKIALGTRTEVPWGWLDVSYRWFDRRYIREDAIKYIDPYGVVDVVAGVRKRVWGITVEMVGRLLNLGSTPYEVIEREPMPGRSFTLSINLSSSIH